MRSTLRLRDIGTHISSNAGDGVALFTGSVVDVRGSGSTPQVVVTGNSGFGLRCVTSTNGVVSTYYSGDVRGVTANAGGNAAGGEIPGCSWI